MSIHIRRADIDDTPLILALIKELADYENLAHEVEATGAMIDRALFGHAPRVFCDLVEWRGEACGMALWHYNFSTFSGRHGIYVEDLYVRPKARGNGVGKALLAHLAARCLREKLTRLEWSVLDWNKPSIAFYEAQGAVMLDQWTKCRISGDALARLGLAARR
jgi:GNAT superfamily N-acetyltransferase